MGEWSKVYIQNLPTYMQLIEKYFQFAHIEKENTSVELLLDKLTFKLPKGLTKKEIKETGLFPVVSQSKDMIVGYSNAEESAISKDLPLIVYGDHSKIIKFVDFPFVIGADGVKLLKSKKNILPKYFYYSLIGLETDTKNYGRHFSLLKKKYLTIPLSLNKQRKVVKFVEDLKEKEILNKKPYFSLLVEKTIKCLQSNSINGLKLNNELTHQQALLKKLRQQILQEAIEGKLTANWRAANPDVEPASALLERIAAEKAELVKAKKIKKQKPLSPINDEEKPFELPDGWVWCRLREITNIVRGGSPRPAGDLRFYQGNIPFLKVADLTATNATYLNSHTYTIKEAGLHKTRKVPANTLMLTNSGATLGIPKICRFETTFNDGIAAFIYMNNDLFKPYFYYVLSSKTQWFLEEASRGQGQPNLNTDIIGETFIFLPPLPEQKAIVTKVEKLLTLCDQLETQITQNQTHAEALMQAVLHEAFS
ncbi:restriction endonuclease subunit S [Candidatus Venteria ishoeyi]|uniref:EcoKI restriction-modification system protein HsdS n=1 Tax=Candidatus Venteria ishoeyi TaxID=1899563 RepID=A0A1H6FC58_9GAMM|nr:restriction endonuclease subunit S [Candidatus Venteria ishoeyi]SEH06971.1 EcoKI restriction-modification system protein HsdS [Candidatus Venteria ishoeyi]